MKKSYLTQFQCEHLGNERGQSYLQAHKIFQGMLLNHIGIQWMDMNGMVGGKGLDVQGSPAKMKTLL